MTLNRPSLSSLARLTALAGLALAACTATISAKEPLRVFYIGNSVTDTIRYDALAKLAASTGDELVWSRHMVPGAPLFWIWQKEGGFIDKEYGPAPQALANFAWDAITVQPFDRGLTSTNNQGDLEIIQEMIDTQLPKNPAVRFYVYSRWPRMVGLDGKGFKFDKNDYDPSQPGKRPDLAQVKPWATLWERPYRPGKYDGSQESRDYFQQVVAKLREANPTMKEPVRMIPVGDVFSALDKKMIEGKVPGFDSVWLLYKDGIHMNNYGSYLTAITFYATLLQKSPVGLPTTGYGDLDPKVVRVFQDTVWEVVSTHPLAGLAK